MDCTASTQTLIFNSNVTSLPFIVQIIDDSVTEVTEIFLSSLVNSDALNPRFDGVIIRPNETNVMINDNDSKQVYRYTMHGD